MDHSEAPVNLESLYSRYIKEREDYETIETSYGFATYKITGDSCYLRDLYVSQSRRRTKVATQFCDLIKKIARDAKCKTLMTTVAPSANGASESMKAVLHYGFKIVMSGQDYIIFKMDI